MPGDGTKSTEQEPPESAHPDVLKLPEEVTAKFTAPIGTNVVPLPVSETVAVHAVLEFTGTPSGEQFTLMEDGRFVTWRAILAELPRWPESPAKVAVNE